MSFFEERIDSILILIHLFCTFPQSILHLILHQLCGYNECFFHLGRLRFKSSVKRILLWLYNQIRQNLGD